MDEHGKFIEKKSLVCAERPDHGPSQIRDVSEIKLGDSVVRHLINNIQCHFTITGKPFLDSNGAWCVKAKYTDTVTACYYTQNKYLETILFLSGLGVVPYNDGLWNKHGWLEKASE